MTPGAIVESCDTIARFMTHATRFCKELSCHPRHVALPCRRLPNSTTSISAPGRWRNWGQQARAWNKGRKAFVLTHPGLYELYGGRLSESLRAADYAVESCLVPEGERSKTLRHAARLFTKLARMGADRQSVIFALGAA